MEGGRKRGERKEEKGENLTIIPLIRRIPTDSGDILTDSSRFRIHVHDSDHATPRALTKSDRNRMEWSERMLLFNPSNCFLLSDITTYTNLTFPPISHKKYILLFMLILTDDFSGGETSDSRGIMIGFKNKTDN